MSSKPNSFYIRRFELPRDGLAVKALLSDHNYPDFYRSDPFFPTQLTAALNIRGVFYVICLLRTDAVIGLIYRVPTASHRSQLSIIVDREYRGLGIARDSCIAATRMWFADMPELLRIETVVGAEDNAGLRVMEKAGFVREAVLRNYHQQNGQPRDAVLFSFVRQQLPVELLAIVGLQV